jgi:type I restriction enzyme, S subunit
MKSWPIVQLDDICSSVDYGHTASAAQEPIGPKFLRITDIQDGQVDWQTVPFCECKPADEASSRLKSGDIVFARTGATTGKSFLIRACPDRAVFASYLIRVRASEKVLPAYLAHFFQTSSYWAQITRSARGAAQAGVNATSLKSLELPLPPFDEQRRIAAILDAADALRVKRRAAIAKLDTLAQSIFIEMFGNPVANERGWKQNAVSDFVAGFESGKNLVALDEEDTESEFRVLKVSAVTSLEYRPDECKPLPPGYTPPPAHFVRPGDLLFSRANTSDLVGATALVYDTPINIVLPDKIWRFVWHEEPRADPHFVWFLFRHPAFRYEIGKRATGTSGSMKNISQEKVFNIRVGLPPIHLQRQFASEVSLVHKTKQRAQISMAKLDGLFTALQHRAFRGEL